jgi:ABC-type nickel/cobalt efflux system permease component RcnA
MSGYYHSISYFRLESSMLNIAIGVLVIFYTCFRIKAVNVTQKQQMFVIMSGMLITLLPYFTFPTDI